MFIYFYQLSAGNVVVVVQFADFQRRYNIRLLSPDGRTVCTAANKQALPRTGAVRELLSFIFQIFY